MRTYKKIISLNFKHSFYENASLASGDIEIIPTPETLRILNNYRILLRLAPSNIEFIHEYIKEDQTVEPVIDINTELKFSFFIRLKNSMLMSLTQMPFLNINRQIAYLSNKKNDKTAKSGKITQNSTFSESDIVPLLPKGNHLMLWNLNTDFTVVNTQNKSVISYNNSTDTNNFENDLEKLESGAYFLQQGKNKAKPFVVNKLLSGNGLMAYIDIFADNHITAEIAKNQPYVFSVDFEPREVYWQYNIIEKYNKIKNLKIIDDTGKLKFDTIENKNNTENKSLTFLSKSKIRLSEFTNTTLKLVAKNGSANYDKVMYDKMPAPKIKNLIMHPENENEYISFTNLYI